MTKEIKHIYRAFPSTEKCIQFLELVLWNNSPACPYCKSKNYTPLSEGQRYHCNTCNTSYSVTVGTVFHKTKCDIQKWFYVISLVFKGYPKISVRDLGKIMGVTKDTASRILKKVIQEKDNLTILAQTILKEVSI